MSQQRGGQRETLTDQQNQEFREGVEGLRSRGFTLREIAGFLGYTGHQGLWLVMEGHNGSSPEKYRRLERLLEKTDPSQAVNVTQAVQSLGQYLQDRRQEIRAEDHMVEIALNGLGAVEDVIGSQP